jgi:ureidoglycolate dehydrogenase (NAD+)
MTLRVSEHDLLLFTRSVLEVSGGSAAQAQAVAEVLVWSDLIGRDSQGVWRLPILAERLRKGGIVGAAQPAFEQLAPAVGVVRGGGGAGHHVGKLAMEHAIRLARTQGIGAVTATESNYFGAGAYYVNQAAMAGMVGIASSNSFPKVLAHGGRRPALGTNPLAFGAPLRNGEAVLLDMATSGAAGSTVRKNLEAGAELQAGVAVDAAGNVTSDPTQAGALLPFGGAKGYGLAVMVELLCGVLAGPGIAQSVHSMYAEPGAVGDNGHFMLAIDIGRLLPLEAFYERMAGLSDWLAASGEPGVVRLPGAGRWRARREHAERGI